MLISTSKRFIYLKTRKTAGTSVEVYFERYCVDPAAEYEERHYRDSVESEWGVVGYRGPKTNCAPWYNHMPAHLVLSLVGSGIWDSYYKFCVERNPYDKVVSRFWYSLEESLRRGLMEADFAMVRKAFGDWTARVALAQDREVYRIGGQVAVNQILRYENLAADLEGLCATLWVQWEPERMPRLKADYRLRGEAYADYYDAESAARVDEAFAWEFEHFGYPKLRV